MDISGINTTTAGNVEKIEKPNDELGKNEFLKLLIAQLQHQDPLNPMEGTEFATQLAQFNSVEQLINLNSGIGELTAAQDQMNSGLNNSLASTLAGKSVKVLSNRIGTDPESSSIHYRLQQLASSVEINVRDATGSVVRSDLLQNIGQGDHVWNWDGKSESGQEVPEGTYTVEMTASNGDKEVEHLTFTEGIVEKVRFTGEGVKVLVNGSLLPLGDVEEISN